MKKSHQVAKRKLVVGDHTLYLVKLCQMGGIQRFIPEDTVNGEILDRTELLLLAKFVEHASTDGCGVRPKDILLGLFQFPVILVAVGMGRRERGYGDARGERSYGDGRG